MSSAWKTPPRAEPMPEIIVKIIGSKYFRYLVEKPKICEWATSDNRALGIQQTHEVTSGKMYTASSSYSDEDRTTGKKERTEEEIATFHSSKFKHRNTTLTVQSIATTTKSLRSEKPAGSDPGLYDPRKQNEKLKTESQSTLQRPRTDDEMQVSRDLPGPTNPSDQQVTANPNDKEESRHPISQQKPESHQKFLTGMLSSSFPDVRISNEANVYCSSVPTGDQSLSYIHSFPRRKSRDWSLNHITKDNSGQPKEIVQRPSITTREDSFLLTLVRRELKSCPLRSSLLDRLVKELKSLDPISSGFLLQSQLTCLFLKLEVPLKLPTVKLLCQRFSRRDSPEMVNYGELLWFLKEASSENLQKNGTAMYNNPRKTPSQSRHRQSTPPQGSDLPAGVNESLLEILKMALRTCQGKFNIESLSLSLRKEDHSFSGCLPLPKVRAICGKHGLYLTLTLLETLLKHQDLGCQGEIKWKNFVKWLNRASSDLSVGKNKKKTLGDLSGVPERPQRKTGHVKTPEENLRPENLTTMTSAPQDAVNFSKNKPASQPVLSPAIVKEAEHPELWIDRFRKLENALYLCDLSNTGVLEKERARRLIHNYNLIYNLSLSPQRIDQALKRFSSGENITLEPALRFLKEL